MANDIIIIGAGIAGMTAGIFGQLNGYQTRIFEQHAVAGGLCTGWKRKGYTFDGCIKYLYGTRAGKSFSSLMATLGIIPAVTFHDHDELVRIEGTKGKSFVLFSDLDRLKEYLMDLAPVDSKLIEELVGAAKLIARLEIPTNDPMTFRDTLHMMRLLPTLVKWTKITLETFRRKIKDSFLREAFKYIYNYADLPDLPMSVVLINLAYHHNCNAGMPFGGSQAVARAVEKRYVELGGIVRYNAKVVQVLTRDGKARGVLLQNGEEHEASTVISAADGYSTIFKMLGGNYLDEQIKQMYDELKPVPPIVQISLGVNRDFTGQSWSLNFPLDEPVLLGDRVHDRLSMYTFHQDPGMAPDGCCPVEIIFESSYDYWNNLAIDPEKYQAAKDDLASVVLDLLEKRFAGIKQQIDVIDVATPITFERYTANWQGSPQGWIVTPKTFLKKPTKTLPGLDQFYMAGQWVEMGGGIPGGARSGRNVVRLVCKQDKKRFKHF